MFKSFIAADRLIGNPRLLADGSGPMVKERKLQTDDRRLLILDNAGMALEIALSYR